jgi:hypothetical protein
MALFWRIVVAPASVLSKKLFVLSMVSINVSWTFVSYSNEMDKSEKRN